MLEIYNRLFNLANDFEVGRTRFNQVPRKRQRTLPEQKAVGNTIENVDYDVVDDTTNNHTSSRSNRRHRKNNKQSTLETLVPYFRNHPLGGCSWDPFLFMVQIVLLALWPIFVSVLVAGVCVILFLDIVSFLCSSLVHAFRPGAKGP